MNDGTSLDDRDRVGFFTCFVGGFITGNFKIVFNLVLSASDKPMWPISMLVDSNVTPLALTGSVWLI